MLKKSFFLFLLLFAGTLSFLCAAERSVIRFFGVDGLFRTDPQDMYSRIDFSGDQVYFLDAEGNIAVSYPVADLHALVFATDYIPDLPTDLPVQTLPQVRLYPNPASETLLLENLPDEADICLFDAHGRLLQSLQASGKAEIGVSSLPAGIYVLRVNRHAVNFIKQ